MIDITPLDVRKKRGDFRKAMRGYDCQEVDTFLDLVAERMEELVKEVMMLSERTAQMQVQVDAHGGREKAVQDALVTAQGLRDEIREQARREAEVSRREAEVEVRGILAGADRQLAERHSALEELERNRDRFLKSMRRLLERELDIVAVEEGRSPLDDGPVDLELSGGQTRRPESERSAADDFGLPPPVPMPMPPAADVGSLARELLLGLDEDPPTGPGNDGSGWTL